MFSEFIARHPKAILILVVFSLLISGYYASQVRIGVDTGRFELKNEAYKTYQNIVKTFGSEEDNVIVVCISRDGSILHKGDLINIIELEDRIEGGANISSMQSIADYVASGIHILNSLNELPENISISIDSRVFADLDKMKDAVGNYEYVLNNGNDSAKNDSYRVFILLPSYTNDSFALAPGGNFSYTYILNESKYDETKYNSTTMLIDEMEIYQNLSRYGAGGTGDMGFQLPEHYDLDFVNKSIASMEFNITRDKIGMEHYNTTYFEWYSYNLSFSLALSLLYSGQKALALSIYSSIRGIMLNSTKGYENSQENWTSYENEVEDFLSGGDVERIINETEYMKNRSYGTLQDYLGDYEEELKGYENSSVGRDEIVWWSNNVLNVSQLMINYTSYSLSLDNNALPVVNGTIDDIINDRGYGNATKLSRIAEENEEGIIEKIAVFYGENMIYQKALDIFQNLKSILMRDESDNVKQYAWNLLNFSFSSSSGASSPDIEPMLSALQSYRRWIFSNFSYNFTTMLWDYLSLEPFEMNYTYESNVSFDMNYTREDMINELENETQENITKNVEKIRNFQNETIEVKIANYTTSLNYTRENLSLILDDLNYLHEKYETLGGENASNMTNLLGEFLANVSSGIREVENYTDEVYSLRLAEDFFSIGDMYFNTLISRDYLSSLVIIGIWNSSEEMKIYNIVKDSKGPVEYHTLSSKVLVKQIEDTATEDMKTFLPLSLILLVVLLYITYRTIKNVLLTLSAVLIALIWLMGFTAMMGWDFDPILLAVPIMMIGIGVDDGIYVTLRYMEEREHRSRERATIITVSSVGGALILTTLTSIAGFLSNTVSSMSDIQRFGILAAAGLLFSFIVMNTFLPAINMIVDSKTNRKELMLKGTQIGAKIALKNPYIVVIIAVLVSLSGIWAFQHINTEFNMKDLAPQNSDIVQYYHYYEKNFNASVEISYIYFEGNLSSPQVLKAMAEVQNNIEDDTTVVHHYPVLSPWSVMKKHAEARRGEYEYNVTFIHLFRESDTNGDGIPDRNITELYSMLQPDISTVMKGNKAIFIIHTDSHDLKRVNLLVKELSADAAPLKKYGKVEIAGDAIVGKASLDEINNNQMRSLALSVISAIAMLIVLFMITKKSITLGIIAAIPILLVVTWNWLLMYFLGISLNVMTNTIASLCVGLGVDYGIHITHRFVEETDRYYDLKKAILRATGNLGRGMLGASTTTIASIGILTLSTIPPLSNFALILSFSIFFAFVSSILVLPSLLVIWSRYRRKHGYDRVDKEVRKAIEIGDYRTLCRYNVSEDYCLLYLKKLIDQGKIKEARKVSERLMEKGIDTRDFFRSQGEINPPFE